MGLFSSVVSIFQGSKDKKFAKKSYQISKQEANSRMSLDQRDKNINKYYDDLSAKNLLSQNTGSAKASLGAYGIKSTSGSALAIQNNIKQEYKDDKEKRDKIFKLNMDTINHNYKFNTEKNLLSYKKNKMAANYKMINGAAGAIDGAATGNYV